MPFLPCVLARFHELKSCSRAPLTTWTQKACSFHVPIFFYCILTFSLRLVARCIGLFYANRRDGTATSFPLSNSHDKNPTGWMVDNTNVPRSNLGLRPSSLSPVSTLCCTRYVVVVEFKFICEHWNKRTEGLMHLNDDTSTNETIL